MIRGKGGISGSDGTEKAGSAGEGSRADLRKAILPVDVEGTHTLHCTMSCATLN